MKLSSPFLVCALVAGLLKGTSGQALDTDGRIGNWFVLENKKALGTLYSGQHVHRCWADNSYCEDAADDMVVTHLGGLPSLIKKTTVNAAPWRPLIGTFLDDDKWTNNCLSCCDCSPFVSVDFICEYGTDDGYAYAFTSFFLNGNDDIDTTVMVGFDNSIRVWVDADTTGNNAPVYQRNYKDYCFNDGVVNAPPDGQFGLTLTPGWHTMLVLVGDEGSDWRFSLTLRDPIPDIVVQPENGPIAICTDVTVSADTSCLAEASVDGGSSGDLIVVTQLPPSPYGFGTTSVTLTVTDENGVDTCIASVEVTDNTSPAIECAGSMDPVAVGDSIPNVWTGVSDNCDGDIVPTQTPATSQEAGFVTVTATAEDDSGNTASCSTPVVFYDPSAGFVTGGGWFYSDAGNYRLDEDAEGRANFGFVAKYRKGATTPSGQTQFMFKAGSLNFHSTSYEWLLVTGNDCAKFKGVGTINGDGEYGFMLTACDSTDNPSLDADTFRMKITDGEDLVYDNMYTTGDDSFDGTYIDGGSIKIHQTGNRRMLRNRG